MSPRDLPLWVRGATAVMLLVAGWIAPRTAWLVAVVGDSVVEVSAAVVAVSVMLGVGMPLGLWPRAPHRERFSVGWALGATAGLGVLVLLSGPTGLPGEFLRRGRGAIPVFLLGGIGWALAWGRAPQRPFGRWYAWAVGCAALTLGGGVIASALLGQLPPIAASRFVQTAAFFGVAGLTGALVTQELAFRRLLVGQSGEAGLLVVVGAALIFGAWHAAIPAGDGAAFQAVAGAAVNGVTLGSLYLMSRSLLVPAVFHAVQFGVLKAMQDAAATATGATGLGRAMWLTNLLAAAAVATVLAARVTRRNGMWGAIPLHRGNGDAPGD